MPLAIHFIFLILCCQPVQAQEKGFDTKKVTAEEIKDSPYFILLAKRAQMPAQSLELFRQALSLRTVTQDDNWVAALRVNMATALFSLGNTKQAFSELLTAEKLYKSTGNKIAQGEVLIIMARFYTRNKVWPEAQKYYKQALALEESVGEMRIAANIMLRLAEIAIEKNELKNAVHYLSYSKKLSETSDDKTGIANSYVRLAEVFRNQKKYSIGERLIIKSALPLYRSSGYKAGRIDCFDGLGKIYHSQKRYSEAKWFFIQANTQARALNDQEGIIISLINLGGVKIDIGDYNLAKRDFKEAEALAQKKGDLVLIVGVKQAYAELYKATGQYQDMEDPVLLKNSLEKYYYSQAESANVARYYSEPSKVLKAKAVVSNENSYISIKIIVSTLIVLFCIFLITKWIK
ncbi:MAG: tetratricopeptide repeat protein [Pyrinomonadaceae bacterium]|nr:tetratricopeptide repeat protein [Sphingobacteriaceae bacterium]